MESTTCEPSAKPHGKRPPGAQRWRRKQTTAKSANIMRDAWVTLAKRCEDFNFPEVTGLIMNAIATSTLRSACWARAASGLATAPPDRFQLGCWARLTI